MARASSQRPGDIPAASIDRELAALPGRSAAELKAIWPTIMGSTKPPPLTRDLLARVLAHRLQEKRFGGLDRRLSKQLEDLTAGRAPSGLRLKIGSVLVREYNGVLHEAIVVEGGFRWQGKVYPSLSAIARAITGTSWNGPRFFGLGKAVATRDRGAGRRGDPPAPAQLPERAGRPVRDNTAARAGRDTDPARTANPATRSARRAAGPNGDHPRE